MHLFNGSMNAIEDVITRIRLCVKPVLFETGIEDMPFAGVGTCFLVKRGLKLFLFTARHVINGESLENLLIFPNEQTNESISFSAAVTVSNQYLLDTDFSDLVLLEIAADQPRLVEGSFMQVIDLKKTSDSWRNNPFDHRFVIMGYPSENRGVEVEDSLILSTQNLLVGRFSGQSQANHCYELIIEDFNGVKDLHGLSGSPVFSWPKKMQDHFHPSFCGMVLRGTANSGKIHFLDAKVLTKAIEQSSKI